MSGDDQCYALPINAAKKVAANILQDGRVQHGWVGLNVSERRTPSASLTSSQWQVLIQQVYSNSPAAQAGFRDQDILLRICTNERPSLRRRAERDVPAPLWRTDRVHGVTRRPDAAGHGRHRRATGCRDTHGAAAAAVAEHSAWNTKTESRARLRAPALTAVHAGSYFLPILARTSSSWPAEPST